MTTRPLVTVITVAYKSAPYIKDTIRSVLAQSYPNIEYIIGDDCSPDNTWDVVNSFDGPRIKKYRNERNLGEYANRNKAIGMASGEYVMFIDGDDVIFPHGIEFFVNQLQAFPEAAYALQKGYQNNMLFPALLEPQEAMANALFGSALLTASFASTFFRTAILKSEGNLSEKYRTGDQEVRLRLACKYPVVLVAGWVTWPRETPGSATSRLTGGIALKEFADCLEPLVQPGYAAFKDPEFLRRSAGKIHAARVGYVRALLRALKVPDAMSYMRAHGIRWREVLRRPEPAKGSDPLRQFTPVEPFRRGFLDRGV